MQNPLIRLLRSTVAVAILAILILPAKAADTNKVIYQASKSKIMTFDAGVSPQARKNFAKLAGCRVLRELPLIEMSDCNPCRRDAREQYCLQGK